MSPRKYSMGRRARSMARTRRRIVRAAMELYQEQPVSSTSMQQVARRADVSPGTVLNHFATPGDLAEAVVRTLVRDLRAPTPEILDGLSTVSERLRALAGALAAFFERAEPWFHVHEREHAHVEAFAAGARDFDTRVTGLVRQALGGGGDTRTVMAIRALFSPSLFRDLRVHGGITADEAAELASEIAVAWLKTHSTREAEQ